MEQRASFPRNSATLEKVVKLEKLPSRGLGQAEVEGILSLASLVFHKSWGRDKPEGDQKDLRCQNVSKHSALLAREWGDLTVGSLQWTIKSFLLKCTCRKPGPPESPVGPPESPVSPPRVWDGVALLMLAFAFSR